MEKTDIHDIEQLKYLNRQYEEITHKLNDAITDLGNAKSRVQVADSAVKKLSNMQNLVLENIRAQKLIIQTNK